MKIALDIGHQLTGDRGAVSADGLSENAYWTEHHLYIVAELTRIREATELKIFRRDDYGNSVAKECAAINEWGADLAISLHLNSSDNPSANGQEIIHYPGSSRGKALAATLNKRIDYLQLLTNRGIKPPYNGRGNTWLSKTKCPAVILELGFLSHAGDLHILRKYGPDLSRAIAHGIIYYLADQP